MRETLDYNNYSYLVSFSNPAAGTMYIDYGTTIEGYYVRNLTDSLGNKRSYEYWGELYRTYITNSRGYETQHEGMAKTSAITSPMGNTIEFGYDGSGNRDEITDVFGQKVNMTWDGLGNVISVTDPLGNTVTMAYDSTNDTLSSLTDAKDNVYNFSYDSRGNLLSVRGPDGNTTNFTYDAYGQLTNLTDANGSRTNFTYDAGGNLTQMRDPLGKTTNYTYDTSLRAASVTDPKGQRFNYTYDTASHLTNVTYPNGTMANYTYSCCKLLSAQDTSGTLNFSYDAVGRISTYTNQDTQSISYEYDSEGNLVNLTYPGNLTVSYEYDADNRLIKVTDWLGHNTTYNYDIGGRLISTTSPGVMTIYEYDNASRVSKLTNWNAVNLTVTSYFEYEYDENSNREQIGTYIPFSNVTFARNTTGYTYNAGNQLVTAGNKTVTYDDNGNMLTIVGSPSTNLTYNALNQLTQYSDGSVNLTFSYDVLGNRISKTSAGVTTKYIVNPTGLPSVLAETDAGGNVTSYYIYGLGLVSKINATSNNTYFYQYDGLGSTAVITDTNGTVVNKYAYDDFGNVATNSVEGISNPFKYVGKYGVQTDANDLLYMRARYYKPSVGRFVNKDPIGLRGGPNQYAYSFNDPINFIDPTGLSAVGIDIQIPVPAGTYDLSDYGFPLPVRVPRPTSLDFHFSCSEDGIELRSITLSDIYLDIFGPDIYIPFIEYFPGSGDYAGNGTVYGIPFDFTGNRRGRPRIRPRWPPRY